jgi:hypothetical protein
MQPLVLQPRIPLMVVQNLCLTTFNTTDRITVTNLENTGMYTAAVLRPNSVLELLQALRETTDLESRGFVCLTPQGEPLPHHMTINLGTFDDSVNKPELLGKSAILYVDSIWYCDEIGACAAQVCKAYSEGNPVNSINEHKHITICLKPPAKPVYSNKIFDSGKSVKLSKNLVLVALCNSNTVIRDSHAREISHTRKRDADLVCFRRVFNRVRNQIYKYAADRIAIAADYSISFSLNRDYMLR